MNTKRNAFTLIELLTVIAVIAVLSAILIPAVGRARESANQSKCISNLRQIGVAVQSYANEHKGRYPEAWHKGEAGKPWCRAIEPYVGMESDGAEPDNLFHCPAVEDDLHHGWSDYGYNENLGLGKRDEGNEPNPPFVARRVNILDPAKVVVVGDCGDVATGEASWHFKALQYGRGFESEKSVPHCRHNGMANLAFLDNHVESLTWEEMDLRKEEMFGRDRFYGSGIGE